MAQDGLRRNQGATEGAATFARGMADKPRVKAPKQRASSASSRGPGSQRRLIVVGAVAVGVALAVLAMAALLGFVGGGGGPDETAARAQLVAAGCTLKSYPGVSRDHINDPSARPKEWNSFPPTTGPHYVTPVVYGFYTDPVELAPVLHGLEHGGVYLLYGSKTPSDTASLLQKIYDRDPRGLVVAPLPELGNKIALGGWTSRAPGSGQVGTGHLAMCTQVNEKAVLAFIKAYRGRGPEGTPLNSLKPGGT